MVTREFHFSEGTSNKYWRFTVDGVTQTVHYGRIGTAGQEATKTFDSDSAATTASDKLIAEKVKKGYVEVAVDGAAVASPSPNPATAAAPKPVAAVKEVVKVTAVEAELRTFADVDESEPANVPTQAAETVDVSLDAEPWTELSEDDYVRAGLRPRAPKRLPTIPPFNRTEAMKK